jgi:hypothetical protein
MCPSFFLAPKKMQKIIPWRRSIALYSSQNWRRKRKKRIVGTSSGFQFVEVSHVMKIF